MTALQAHSLRSLVTRGSTTRIFQPASCRWFSSQKNSAKDATATQDTPDYKKYAKTLNLPSTKFPIRTNPAKSATYNNRTQGDLYRWQWSNNVNGPLFVLHDGPPYANGDLHMGHALNKILKDIINRYHVSLGHRVHYVPGWDCHGLPIENKVLKTLGKESSELSPGVIRAKATAYARKQASAQAKQFAEYGIMADWDANSEYLTLNHDYEIRQLRIFQKMVEKGLIYRDFRPVYYSPSSRSALAEAELEYHDNHASSTAYVTFEMNLEGANMSSALRSLVEGRRKVYLMAWTTTPWTLTANMGIAVGPNLEYAAVAYGTDPTDPLCIFVKDREPDIIRFFHPNATTVPVSTIKGSDLVGATYWPIFHNLLPDFERSQVSVLPVVAGSHVTADTGTGLVHCAPAHGQEDYGLFKSESLLGSSGSANMICHIDLEARFTSKVEEAVGSKAAADLVGKSVFSDGVAAIIDLLRHAKALVKVQKIQHRYPYDWRTDEPVVIMPTSQWFANLDGIKNDGIKALQDVSFYPPHSRNRLESFVRSRSEWCISRQRVWGVPIPYLRHKPSGQVILDAKSLNHIIAILDQKGTSYWWKGDVGCFIPPELRESIDEASVSNDWELGTDTMDVWFDSGTSWSLLPEKLPREASGRRFWADICLEGSDQHRGWFQSQLLTSVATSSLEEGSSKSASPYGTLITHGMVVDESGKKMSKSLGNIISPATIIRGGTNHNREPVYGLEVLRLWTASVDISKDMSIGPTVLSQCAEGLRKIRNTVRFILGNLGDRRPERRLDRSELGLAERYLMHELYKLEQIALEGYANHDFPRVLNSLYNFSKFTLSAFYFDITKDCLYANAPHDKERSAILTVFEKVLDTIMHVVAPILPHLAEEVQDLLGPKDDQFLDQLSFFSRKWNSLNTHWYDLTAENDMSILLALRKEVNKLLEKARHDRKLGSSLEANLRLILPNASKSYSANLLLHEAKFLKTLCIVSNVVLIQEDTQEATLSPWEYTGLFEGYKVAITSATLSKCLRCWTFTCYKNQTLCQRCLAIV